MSFIVQEIPTPTVFKVGQVEENAAASGTITFYIGEQDVLIYNQTAAANWNLNISYDPTTSLDVAMGSGDVANVTFGARIGSTAYLQEAITIDGSASGINFAFETSSPVALTSAINYYNIGILKQTDLGPFYVTVAYDFTRPFASGLPTAPTGVSASVLGVSSVSVTYIASVTPSNYPVIEYKVSGSTGIVGYTAGTSITIGASVNVPVSYKVQARNVFGYGTESASSNTVTPGYSAGQDAYVSPGTYTWIAPSFITSVSVVAVGGGGGPSTTGSEAGGGGGGLGYKNNITISPGSGYTVVVGATASQSYFISTGTVRGNGGGNGAASPGTGGTYTGDGGGNGGNGGAAAGSPTDGGTGGGAGGYAGNGGNQGVAGAGGGGGGGAQRGIGAGGGAGGGVGILGQGANGAAGTAGGGGGGGGGSGGGGGGGGQFVPSRSGGSGGLYGGGSGGPPGFAAGGSTGAVRIIWASSSGPARAFPSTNTGNL